MPTYQYACADCGEGLEVVQKFTDDALTECPNCGGNLRKVFSAVGIVFKGSGFYRNDSRGSGKSSTPVTTTSEKKAETKSDSAPAKTESSSSSTSSSPSTSSSTGSTSST
ncbi:FmdB family transcriptional regulator [Actinocorallia sp. API 0066]|uniref:FmdB family zinc ribbon protein n=1 Tax=Actinocorallia sp. API 0066 TaxID=2896846 RepID=UPI001E32B508|nr:FmdB family zinc ribbon protein [Actinocorallia sp. API 0066]MCD0447726.1 FmdB family transcriptional regulator [Actinocorallia sp. API 0066]